MTIVMRTASCPSTPIAVLLAIELMLEPLRFALAISRAISLIRFSCSILHFPTKRRFSAPINSTISIRPASLDFRGGARRNWGQSTVRALPGDARDWSSAHRHEWSSHGQRLQHRATPDSAYNRRRRRRWAPGYCRAGSGATADQAENSGRAWPSAGTPAHENRPHASSGLQENPRRPRFYRLTLDRKSV